MKATITQEGYIKLEAETVTEAFAMKYLLPVQGQGGEYCRECGQLKESRLIFSTEILTQGTEPAGHIKKAPWTDYEGNYIYDGDTIRHPDGRTGTVKFDKCSRSDRLEDQWVVDYGEGQCSRLCLQVGGKGQAVAPKQ